MLGILIRAGGRGFNQQTRQRCRKHDTEDEMSDTIDPRVARTYQLLSGALLELLATRKLHKITVQEIARVAGVNRATFYAHFYDKYALYRHVVRSTFLETLGRHLDVERPVTRESVAALVVAVFDYFDFLNRSCPPADRELRPMAEIEVQRVLSSLLLRGREGGDGERAIGAREARFVAWALFGSALDSPVTTSTATRDEAYAHTTELILRVLAAPRR